MKSQKIAVIGAGISGLGSALILSENHEVYLFEKENRFGGHSNTITINKEDKQFKVDTGFIVYNDNNYPYFSRLLSYLKIWYNSHRIAPLIVTLSVPLGKTNLADF